MGLVQCVIKEKRLVFLFCNEVLGAGQEDIGHGFIITLRSLAPAAEADATYAVDDGIEVLLVAVFHLE